MEEAFCTPPRVKKNLLSGNLPVTDRKRALFPSGSPDEQDELAHSLSSSPSTYSPPLPSPDWSPTPKKGKRLSLSSHLEKNNSATPILNDRGTLFQKSPRRSPRVTQSNSPIHSPQKYTNVDILTMLNSPEKDEAKQNVSTDFVTPLTNSDSNPNSSNGPRQSHVIKTVNFYGSSAPLLARNEANSVAGIKKIFRAPIGSKVKTKLFTDNSHSHDRKHRHSEGVHRSKKRKELFTGVGHSLRPEKRKRSLSDTKIKMQENSLVVQPSNIKSKKENIREKIFNSLDFSKMPYMKKKSKKGFYYPVLKFTKPERTDVKEDTATKRKIFKTTLKSPGRAYYDLELQTPQAAKKRKLCNPNEDFLNSTKLTNASDILDLIEDGKVIDAEDEKLKEGVDDLILQLESEQEESNSESCVNGNDSTFSNDDMLDLSNLSISDVVSEDHSVLENTFAVKIINSPMEEESNMSPIKNPDPMKENVCKTPPKLFSVFEKRSSKLQDLTNKSIEKLRTYSSAKKWHPMGDSQYQIDAGQKRFGASQCSTCGIVYQLGDPDDEMVHEKYHKEHKTFRHAGWANEKVVGQHGLDRIILVTSENKQWWNKVTSVLAVVNDELGYSDSDQMLNGVKVYLYITNKHIAGCLVASLVSHAYKMLISEPGIDICSEDSYPVRCGVNRMWTHPTYRHQKIATRLVDAMRRTFFFGYYLSVDEFAFSTPTEDGKAFAKHYTKKTDYLIYSGW